MHFNIFHGRIGRKELFIGLAIYFFLILIPAAVYAVSIAEPGQTPQMIQQNAHGPIFAAQILFVILMLGLFSRRLHDLNKPVWMIGLSIVPIVNFVFQAYLLITPSSPENNEFGHVNQKHTTLEIIGFWNGSSKLKPNE